MNTGAKDTTAAAPSPAGDKRQADGSLAEARAAAWLEGRGLRVLARNYRVKGGEIDLVCRDGRTTVFVEVRLRRNGDFGGAAASITRKKQQRLILAARHWLQEQGDSACRFDCVLLQGEAASAPLEWIRNAFDAD